MVVAGGSAGEQERGGCRRGSQRGHRWRPLRLLATAAPARARGHTAAHPYAGTSRPVRAGARGHPCACVSAAQGSGSYGDPFGTPCQLLSMEESR